MKPAPYHWLLIVALLACLSACSSFRPKELGLVQGKLRPCPPAPKCVSSYYEKGIHHIDPLTYSGSKEDAYKKLISVIAQIEGSAIVTTQPDYIYARFILKRFNWSDNAEFLFDDEHKLIQYSSSPSSKIGFYDWGKNRQRALLIKELFEKE